MRPPEAIYRARDIVLGIGEGVMAPMAGGPAKGVPEPLNTAKKVSIEVSHGLSRRARCASAR